MEEEEEPRPRSRPVTTLRNYQILRRKWGYGLKVMEHVALASKNCLCSYVEIIYDC